MPHLPDIFLQSPTFEVCQRWFAERIIQEDPSLAELPAATVALLFEHNEMVDYVQRFVSLDSLTPEQWCDFSFLMETRKGYTPSFYIYYKGQPQPKSIQRGMVHPNTAPKLEEGYIPRIVDYLGFDEPNEVVYHVVKITHELHLAIADFFNPKENQGHWPAEYYILMFEAYIRTGKLPVAVLEANERVDQTRENILKGDWENDGWNDHRVSVIRSDLREVLRNIQG